MANKCPSCNKADLTELVPGIMQCPACNKVFKGEEEEKEEKVGVKDEIEDGDFWMKNTSLNPKYEVAEKGISVFRDRGKRWIAVLLCHSSYMKGFQYIRLSWFKLATNKHAGMIKIDEFTELDNLIIALERIDKNFDENFQPIGKISYEPISTRTEAEKEEIFDEKKKMCPSCKKTQMKRARNKKFFECVRCGEIIVLQDGAPIYNIPDENLPLSYTSEFPVNYYIPDYGITTHYHIANWKGVVIIHSKDNPDKRWLRFYWWERDLQDYIKSDLNFGVDGGLRWQAKRGVSSPNMYLKENVRPMIDALIKMRDVWVQERGIEIENLDIPDDL